MDSGSVSLGRRDRQDGFTLIELMVVVLILAILIAILIPVFIGAQHRAEDRATHTTLRSALIAAKTVYSDKEDYTFADVPALSSSEPGLAFVPAAAGSTGPKSVSVNPVNRSYIVFAAYSKSGTCFYISDDATSAGAMYAAAPGVLPCTANSAPAQGAAVWQTSW
jgi:type IV pilus assembly protein PilA